MAIYLGNTLLTGPSGGGGDAVLANNQTFTGQNTFSDTAIFSNTGATGSIVVAERIAHQGELNTYISFAGSNTIFFYANGDPNLTVSTSNVLVNALSRDVDFEVRKSSTGNAISVDTGTDTFTVNTSNIVGVASSETGTWTPTWSNVGTIGTQTATYSKVGETVTIQAECFIAVGTSTSAVELQSTSLPFSPTGTYLSVGSFRMGTQAAGFLAPPVNTTEQGVVSLSSSAGGIQFVYGTNTLLTGNDVDGFISFTITYITT